MSLFHARSASQQVADHLREEIARGTWVHEMPGSPALAAELGVHRKTVEAAMVVLEESGIVENRGPGRRRRVCQASGKASIRRLRVAFLRYDQFDFRSHYLVDLKHKFLEAGHTVSVAPKTLVELKANLASLARLVEKMEADAWVVVGGSKEVLEWFSLQPTPVFAFFGRMRSLPIAGTGPDKVEVYREVVRRLVALGHRRVVQLARHHRGSPNPGVLTQGFLDELKDHGVQVGPYNIPHWDDTAGGFQRCLDSLFRATPPTALLIDQPSFFFAAQQHLSRSGILAPEHVSLICTDPDLTFEWCQPSIAHISWDSSPWVRRALQWADNLSYGKDDRQQLLKAATLVEGGTMGPAPK
jgi:DNA-binding LacI/PurR family transcriptional regulator